VLIAVAPGDTAAAGSLVAAHTGVGARPAHAATSAAQASRLMAPRAGRSDRGTAAAF